MGGFSYFRYVVVPDLIFRLYFMEQQTENPLKEKQFVTWSDAMLRTSLRILLLSRGQSVRGTLIYIQMQHICCTDKSPKHQHY